MQLAFSSGPPKCYTYHRGGKHWKLEGNNTDQELPDAVIATELEVDTKLKSEKMALLPTSCKE